MRPLTFTTPAFQSAVSIKDGCSSYVFPIHQRPRDARPRTDGQLDMMEGERVGIRQGSEGKVKILRNEKEKNGSQKRNAAEITVKAREWRRKNVRDLEKVDEVSIPGDKVCEVCVGQEGVQLCSSEAALIMQEVRQGSVGSLLYNRSTRRESRVRGQLAEQQQQQQLQQQPGCRWTSTPTSLPLANANGSDLRDRWSGPPGEEGLVPPTTSSQDGIKAEHRLQVLVSLSPVGIEVRSRAGAKQTGTAAIKTLHGLVSKQMTPGPEQSNGGLRETDIEGRAIAAGSDCKEADTQASDSEERGTSGGPSI
ncbi:hypothetical protein NQZ68_005591 [Dissostichus eleginoides]|nr:hypothetical protein NQZ68_005591 [Dissostichus eleginoides]